MQKQIPLLLFFFIAGIQNYVQAQLCPTDIDFEGGITNWVFYRGTVASGPIYSLTPTAAVPGLHTQTSGTGTDPYGGFPVVSPGGGAHSLKLGHDSANNCAERATYFVHVPATGNYSLIYRYAAVLEDGAHAPADQSRFIVTATDSATGSAVSCIDYTYEASGSIPSFLSSSTSGVYYKSWTMGNMKFYGWGGHTIRLDFTTAACVHGDHWGYGYIDMSCNLFTNAVGSCAGSTTLTAPDGYASYQWKDSATFSVSYGTSQVVAITTPTTATTYAVILTPYAGYGCKDTLYTKVYVPMTITGPDTACLGGTIMLSNPVPGGTWSSSSIAVATVGSTGITTGVSTGTATISYAIGAGCASAKTITVVPCAALGTAIENVDESFRVYPNPGIGEINILTTSSSNNPAHVIISDMTGAIIVESDIMTNKTNIMKLNLSPGVYIISYLTVQGRHWEKLMIEK